MVWSKDHGNNKKETQSWLCPSPFLATSVSPRVEGRIGTWVWEALQEFVLSTVDVSDTLQKEFVLK